MVAIVKSSSNVLMKVSELRCQAKASSLIIVYGSLACDYEYYDDEDEFTKRDWHVSPYCMTPWEYDVGK